MALDIDEELSAVREKLGSLPECSLVTCQRAQVRVRVSQTAARTLDACVQFPDDFPEAQVLLELKSKSVAQRFLDSVVRQFEKEPHKYIAHPDGQVITAVRYVVDAVRANRLCICTDEIAQIRKLLDLDSPDTSDSLKAYLEAVSELIERVYCGHIFHHHCLDVYMKTPPFTGGKKCPKCQLVIYHEKWKETERTREERWAHQQAKQRELEESFNITLDEGCSNEILTCLKDFHIQAATCVRSIFSNEFYAKYCHTHVVPIAQKWKKTSEHWHSMAGICLTQPNSDAPKTPILSMPNGPETPQKFESDHDSSNLTRNGSKPDDLLACLVEVDSARLGCKEEVLKCKSVAACLGYGTWQLYISNLRHRQWFEYISKLRLFSDNSMNQMVHTIQSCLFSV